ncbi:hypothetical protein Tco_1548935 [Tanacetum coccineum]
MHGNSTEMRYDVSEMRGNRETRGNAGKRRGNVPKKRGNVSKIVGAITSGVPEIPGQIVKLHSLTNVNVSPEAPAKKFNGTKDGTVSEDSFCKLYTYDPVIQDIINTIEGSPSADVSSVSSMYEHLAKSAPAILDDSLYADSYSISDPRRKLYGVHEVVGEVLRLAKSYVVNIPDKLSLEQAVPILCAAINIEDDSSVGVKTSNADDLSTVETLSAEKVKLLLAEATLAGKSYEENGSEIADATEDDVSADQVATLSKTITDKKAKENGSSVTTDRSSYHSGRKGHDYSSKKGVKVGRTVGENELSKFSDTSSDALLDDLFQPNDKLDDRLTEASMSASSSHVNQGNTFVTDSGKINLATQLRAIIAQKQMENEQGQSNRGVILHLMMGVLKKDVIGIDGLGFDDKLPSDNLSHLQVIAAPTVLVLADSELGSFEDMIDIDIAEVENASLHARIKTIEAVEKVTRNHERLARIRIEQQLAAVQESHRQDREDFKKFKELVTS